MVEEVKSPIYATGVGLVLRGLAADRVSGGDNTGQRTKPSGEKGGGIFTQIKKWLKDEVDVEDFKQ
jgi:hypothetical protein